MVPALLVTLRMDMESFAHFNALRQAHFPPERNIIPAHLTLFHALPGEQEARIRADLQRLKWAAPFTLQTTELRNLGRGVAYNLQSPELALQRSTLAEAWQAWLTPQDSQRFDPHITVQNKTTPQAARALWAELTRDFIPHTIRAEGLQLWRYLGGPWESLDVFPFEIS